ncbi:unnamed protein product, partial [Brenthis ino]
MEQRRTHKGVDDQQYKYIHKLIQTKVLEAEEKWMVDQCIAIEEFEARYDYFNVHRKVREITGTFKTRNMNCNVLLDDQGNPAKTIEDKLNTWQNYITTLFHDVRPALESSSCGNLDLYLKMKQRTRLMHSGDDLIPNMNGLKDSENFPSEIQLYRIKPQDHFIEAQVQEGDTLQAIALRFHCSISELKRINNIHKDNEIFARRTIKVPVTPYSVLTELVPTQPSPQPIPSTSNQDSTSLMMHNLVQNPVENKLHLQSDISNGTDTKDGDFAIDCNTVVLNSTLTPSVVPYTDAEQSEYVSEDTQLLPNKPKVPVEAVVVKQLTSQGADFGLKWYHLICCLLVLGVVTPLLYVMFYLSKPLHPSR